MSKDEEDGHGGGGGGAGVDSDAPSLSGGDGRLSEDLRDAAEQAVETERLIKDIDERAARYKRASNLTDDEIKEMIASANARLPRVRSLLEKDGITGDLLDARVLQLAVMPYTEDAILSYLVDKPPETTELATVEKQHPLWRRRAAIVKHSIIRWWNKERAINRLLYILGWGLALIGPTIQKGFTWSGITGIVIVAILRIRASLGDLDYKEKPVVDANQRRRQLKLEALIDRMQRWSLRKPRRKLTSEELFDFRRDVLDLINSHVRDHRSDTKGTQIYTNLLVRRGGGVTVIARSDLVRPVPELYTPEECSLAWKTLTTGTPEYSGDIYKDAPRTRPGKRYNSVLVLPVKQADKILGAVSIDSEARYHFDSVFASLHAELAPYVQLLAIALAEDHDTNA